MQDRELAEVRDSAAQEKEAQAEADVSARAAALEHALQQAQQALRDMQLRHDASQRQIFSMQVHGTTCRHLALPAAVTPLLGAASGNFAACMSCIGSEPVLRRQCC